MIEICAQRQSLLDCQKHALVMGGPGSGKTTIALKKAVKRIEEGLLPGQSIIFLSFSRAAVTRIVEASKIDTAKDQRTLLDVQTFHSFFWSLLSSHSYLLGTPRKLRILLPHDERALSKGIKEDDLFWNDWLKERERLWREDGRIAFDFFAPAAVELLERSDLMRRILAQRHPLFIVDEAQDTGQHAWRCIEILSQQSQIICLADIEQQIFDYLPGIGPERIDAIKQSLNPLPVDLGSQNHRSASTEIAIFGRDILNGVCRGSPYKGVSKLTYNPKIVDHQLLRRALGIVFTTVKKATGENPKSVVILCTSGSSAVRFSSYLNDGEKPIKHKLLFDETEALLASRFAAFLLEPTTSADSANRLGNAIDLLSDIKKASGSKEAEKLTDWAQKLRAGKMPRAALVQAVGALVSEIGNTNFSGDPAQDWRKLKTLLRASNQPALAQIAVHLEYLITFNRGKRINSSLAEMWQSEGSYTRARDAVEFALAQDQLLDGLDDPNGIQVMTIHKAKGKQFDGVILIRSPRRDGTQLLSNFIWRGDAQPYPRSRKILNVAVTRAKIHTLILDPAYPKCPIIGGHKL